MRIRFLRTKEYSGIKTVINNGIVSVIDSRFFVEFGQILNISDVSIVSEDAADIMIENQGIFRIPLSEMEFSEPTQYSPSDCGCK